MKMFETIAFYFFAILTLSMALVVITTTNILYAITALASSMVFISAFSFYWTLSFWAWCKSRCMWGRSL